MPKKKADEDLRRTGIAAIGDVPWGTHFCQFYETREDLIDTLVPYFREGLLANEFCMWVCALPLKKEQAKAALKAAVPDLHRHIKKRQIEILDYSEWYTKTGKFDEETVLDGWVSKLEDAQARGFDGLRLTGNTFWLEKSDWADFAKYEEAVNDVIGRYKMLAICTYSLEKCGAAEIADVIANHQFALLKRRGKWEIIESARHKKTEQALRDSESKFRIVADNTYDFEFWVGPDGRYVYASPACERITGRKAEDFLARPDLRKDIVHPNDRPIFEAHVREEQSRRKPGEVDHRIIRLDGSIVWIGHACQPVFGARGEFLGTRGSNRDITARKIAEGKLQAAAEELAASNEELRASSEELQCQREELQAANEELQAQNEEVLDAQDKLHQSEQRFRSLFSSMAEGCILHAVVYGRSRKPVDYRILEVNPAGEEIIGISRKNAVGQLASELYGTGHAPYLDVYARVAESGRPESFETYFAPMDKHFQILVFSPTRGQFATAFTDITARKKTEEALRYHASLVENISDAAISTNPSFHILSWNPAAKRIYGWKADEVLGRTSTAVLKTEYIDQTTRDDAVRQLNRQGSWKGEVIQRKKDGTPIHISSSVSLIKDGEGKRVGAIAINRDITARKAAEERNRYLASFPELNTSPVLEFDYSGRIRYVNPAAKDLTDGMTPSAVVKMLTGMSKAHLKTLGEKNEPPAEREFTLGGMTYLEKFVCSPGGGIIRVYLIDITARKRAEETVRQSQADLNRAQAVAHAGSWRLDTRQSELKWSDETYRMFGIPIGTPMTYEHFLAVVHPEDRELVDAKWTAALKGAPYDLEHRIVAGETVKWVREKAELEFDPAGVLLGGFGTVQDITERKRNEEILAARTIEIQKLNESLEQRIDERTAELRNAIEKLQQASGYNRNLIEASLDPLVTIGRDGKITDVNAATEEITGFSRVKLIGTDFSGYFSDPDLARAGYRKAFQEGFVRDYPLYIRSRDGRLTPVLYNASVYRDIEGGMMGVFAAARDITQHMRDDAEIKAANAKLLDEIAERRRLVAAVDQAGEGIAIMDPAGIVRYINPAFGKACGWDRPVLGKSYLQVLEEEAADASQRARIAETFQTGGTWGGRMIRHREDGRPCELDVSITPVRDESGEVANFLAIERDVTQEARVEQHLRQIQKVEALGTLAGGIAHDFNNILNPIFINTELALFEAAIDDKTKRSLEMVLKAAERGRDLVKQIITFSRQKEQERRPIQAGPIVKETLKLLRSSLPSTIEIHEAIGPESGFVVSDPSHIHQIVMNLCGNAAHAMREKGGRLDVFLADVEVDEEIARVHPDLKPGPFVRLTVGDTGHGMTREVLDRAFDPFYTTKKPGEGSGMGLAVIQAIVRNAGGAIVVYSEVGKGATFNVFLPRIEAGRTVPEPRPSDIPTGTERILFVDDEPVQAESARMMLERLGYDVVAQTDGQAALALFAADPGRFDLVITDQTMPHITGAKLAEELIRLRPDLPVIICTGFSEKVDAERAMEIGAREFVMKPFSMRDMAEAIRRALKK